MKETDKEREMTDPTRNDRQAVYTYFMTCGPLVKISLGTVIKGIVRPDYIVVHEAPPRVTREIVSNFNMVSLTEGVGLMIPIAPMPKD